MSALFILFVFKHEHNVFSSSTDTLEEVLLHLASIFATKAQTQMCHHLPSKFCVTSPDAVFIKRECYINFTLEKVMSNLALCVFIANLLLPEVLVDTDELRFISLALKLPN